MSEQRRFTDKTTATQVCVCVVYGTIQQTCSTQVRTWTFAEIGLGLGYHGFGLRRRKIESLFQSAHCLFQR